MNERKMLFRSAAIILAGIACNIGVKELTHIGPTFPLYMDSIGTVAATLCGGLVPGMLTGLLSNLSYGILALFTHRTSDTQTIYALCNMGTAVAVFLFARTKRRGLTILDLSFLAVIVTLVNSVIGGLISTYFFGGFDRYPSDYLVAGLLIQDVPVIVATILSRLPLNVIDKTIAVFAGYGLFLAAKKIHLTVNEILSP